MGLTFKRKDSLEKMFEEFAIPPKEDKMDKQIKDADTKQVDNTKKEATNVNFTVNQVKK